MVGNSNAVTTAPARTSAPSVHRNDLADSGTVAPAGNNASGSGGKLPPAPPVVDVERAVARLNELATGNQRALRFEIDRGSGRTVITVINATTKEVIRQIPPEELQTITRNLEQFGSLMNAWG
jgi:flagellar protein FlaG